ncbi:MAG TPA: NADPH:quinone reductase [Streptosporangiaceae bacterium]
MSIAGEMAGKATMRAAFFGRPGPAEAVQVGELPVPVPGPTDVLVAVEVAVINMVDTLIRSGRWPTLMPLPFVTGRDLVGTVATAGAGSGFSPGDRVWSNSLGHAGRQGTCAEYAVVPGDRLYPLPDGAAAAEAAAAFHCAATAYIGLHHRARARAGQTILVGGAAGGIGSALIRFASEAGLRVIATARPGDHARCLEQGASAVFDFGDPGLAGRVLDVAPGGADIHWDTSGRVPLNAMEPMTASGGKIIVTAGIEPQPPGTSLLPIYTRDISVIGFVISLATVTELADAARAINRHLASGGFTTKATSIMPLGKAAEAHALIESRQSARAIIQIGRQP